MKIAWVFPGQGSQKLGMGKDVINLYGAKRKFDYASNEFDKDLYKICEDDSPDSLDFDLNNTKNTQIWRFLTYCHTTAIPPCYSKGGFLIVSS